MKLRVSTLCLLAVCLLALVSIPAFAQAPVPKAQAPVLLTSCGQSPGPTEGGSSPSARARLRPKTDAERKDLAAKPYKTLIIVTGSSLKGMGGAGVSIDDELSRAGALIAEAKKRGITVIGAHVEGMERRAKNAAPGDNSDEMSIDAVCPKSQFLIVRKDGDEDGRFTTLGKKFNIPVVALREEPRTERRPEERSSASRSRPVSMFTAGRHRPGHDGGGVRGGAGLPLSTELAMFGAALGGALVGRLRLPARHVAEGAATYLDINLIFVTATLFMNLLKESGGVAFVVGRS